jgi:transcriptional regulator
MPNTDFETWSDLDVAELIAAYPLAWIVSGGTDFAATVMPMLLDLDPAGRPVSLTGHFPKSNPHFQRLRDDPRALFLFQGPHGYLSPALVSARTWAPTWNFATVRITAEVAFDDTLTFDAIERLVTHMEAGRPEPWSTAAMGARYERLRKSVIGFRAPILSLAARFKLGQDEQPAVLAEIVEHLDDGGLAQWMRRLNPDLP